MRITRRYLGILSLFFLAGAALLAQESKPAPKQPPPAQKPNVFDLPGLVGGSAKVSQDVVKLLREGKHAEAEKLLAELAAGPEATAANFYNLACAQALQGKKDAAIASLTSAVDKGFRQPTLIKEDTDLISLRGDARFQALVRKIETIAAEHAAPPAPPPPRVIAKGSALVATDNTVWDERKDRFLTAFRLADDDPRKKEPAVLGHDKVGELIRQWQTEGTAAGLLGILYDNHDRRHSSLPMKEFPQLTLIAYGKEATGIELEQGLQVRQLFNLPTFGNSSTAVKSGPFWRSMTRYGQVSARSAMLQYEQYTYNHLYIYPEHNDYDPGHNGAAGKSRGYGDVYPAHTPYVITTQGSSGSDKPFMDAVACTLAAFQPQTRQKLVETKLLMPTMQMIFRRSNKQVASDADYLTGQAHPIVFQGNQIDLEKMVRLAHEIPADRLPPMVQLQVVSEDQSQVGVDYFESSPAERLFDTPAAIARIYRTTARERRMVVSAEKSYDANKLALKFHWVLLRGRPEEVQIKPMKEDGSVVEIVVHWFERFPIAPGANMETNRVDIAAFVHNGAYYSAPGIVSILCPDIETRKYRGDGKIESVDYRPHGAGGNYVDPMVYTPKQWRDEYHYDSAGALTGWTRTRGKATEEFTPEGKLITKRGADGKPLETRRVAYQPKQDRPEAPPRLEQVVVEENPSASREP